MKKTLLLVLALAVIPVGVDAQVTPSASCAALSQSSPLEDLRSCAEQGNALAQFNLGRMYFRGTGVPEDDVEAVRLFRLAAEQGHAGAQGALGVMYANGDGVPEDDTEAVRLFRLAAEQGHAVAQVALGFMYANGEGVPGDDAEAVRWYRLAAEQGHAGAQHNLGRMYADGDGVPEDDVEAYACIGWQPSKVMRIPRPTSGICTPRAMASRRTLCSPTCGSISRRPKDMRVRRRSWPKRS